MRDRLGPRAAQVWLFANAARCEPAGAEDQRMANVDVPFFGGPLDGREIDVEVDDDGYPPAQLPETLLWFAYGSELLNVDLRGRYELEPVAGTGPPWLYAWIDTSRR